YFQLAAFTLVVYDHCKSLDHVTRIWSRRFSGATILFPLNRYITPLQFIVGVTSFFDPAWAANVSVWG
ncbi:hypothetical protein M422DRAFT_157584, partial [Sphaerobolus stellatus SS14]